VNTWPQFIPLFLTRSTSFSFLDVAEGASATVQKTKTFRHKEPQIGRSSDNRRFRFPNYKRLAALPNGIAVIRTPAYFIRSPPCARFARALGAPRTAHFATPPLGAGALVITLELQTQTCSYFPLMTRASTRLFRRNQISSETAGYIAFAAAVFTGLCCAPMNFANHTTVRFALDLPSSLRVAGYLRAADAAQSFLNFEATQRPLEYQRYPLMELLDAVIPVSHTDFELDQFALARPSLV